MLRLPKRLADRDPCKSADGIFFSVNHAAIPIKPGGANQQFLFKLKNRGLQTLFFDLPELKEVEK